MYAFDNLTQMEISDRIGMPQTTVSLRLTQANRKLQAAGIGLNFPGRGRRPGLKFHSVDGEAIDRMVMDDDRNGRRAGHWVDASKVSRG